MLDIIQHILDDLKNYKKDRETSLFECIEVRLNESLKNYIIEIEKDTKYLNNRDTLKLAKKLSK